jgi:hypothetical protein
LGISDRLSFKERKFVAKMKELNESHFEGRQCLIVCVFIQICTYIYNLYLRFNFVLTYTLLIYIEDIFAKLQNELRDLMSNTKDKVDHAKPQLEVSI